MIYIVALPEEESVPAGLRKKTAYLHREATSHGTVDKWTDSRAWADPFISEITANNVARRKGVKHYKLVTV